jgi:hypothetical protein
VSRRDVAATLARLGVDAVAVRAGQVTPADLASRLVGADGAALAAALAEVATPEVAALLTALEAKTLDRAVRKEIRRSLYRLRQRGVAVPEPASRPAPVSAASPTEAEGFVSGFDARGDRVLWIARALHTGGSWVVAATANEPGGLRDVHAAETSRKQLRQIRRRMSDEAGVRLVPTDWRTVDALLVEAHERAAASERERDYLRLRPRLTAEPPPPAAEPVSARVSPPSAEETPALLAGSAALLEEPELRGWYPTAEAAAPFVEEISGLRASPLVLSRVAEEERVREVLRRAASSLFPPAVLERRLRGTAYVLAETGHGDSARRALAVARVLGERPADAHDVPVVAALVERAVGTLLAQTTAREDETRRSSLVVTPGEYLRDRASSRPGRTRA